MFKSFAACKVSLKNWSTPCNNVMLGTLNTPTLGQRRKAFRLCLMHKLVELEAPEIVPLNPRTCLYNTCYNQLGSLNGHTLQYLNSFFPSTINLWNKLSSDDINFLYPSPPSNIVFTINFIIVVNYYNISLVRNFI